MPAYPITDPEWNAPVIRTLQFDTLVIVGENGVEQRWPRGTGIESWTLTYSHLTLAHRDALLAVFETAKGSYSQALSLEFQGTNYTGLYFDADELTFTEAQKTQYQGTVKLCTVVRSPDAGSLPSDFPALSTGAKLQLPYTHSRAFATVTMRTEGGRFAYSKRDASLHTWSAGGTVLTDDEASDLWDMFRLAGGRWKTFGFTDPDSEERFAKCRFGSDSIEWRMMGAGLNSITCTIQELL